MTATKDEVLNALCERIDREQDERPETALEIVSYGAQRHDLTTLVDAMFDWFGEEAMRAALSGFEEEEGNEPTPTIETTQGGIYGPYEGAPDESSTSTENWSSMVGTAEARDVETVDLSEEYPDVTVDEEENGDIEPNDHTADIGQNQSHEGKDYEAEADVGERHQQTIEFFDENIEEWVSYTDFAEWMGRDPEEFMSKASRALRNLLEREDELPGELETALRQGPHGPLRRYYRYWPPGVERVSESEEEEADESPAEEEESAESESESEERPATLTKGTHAHQTLALLTHLYERTEERQTRNDLAEYGRLEPQQFSNALAKLKNKGFVDLQRQEPNGTSGNMLGLWKPTDEGREELDKVGGFRVN